MRKVVRALMYYNNPASVVLCYNPIKKHFFLPGGWIEDNETPLQALARELKEEISFNHPIDEFKFAGEITTEFSEGETTVQEKSYYYVAKFVPDILKPMITQISFIKMPLDKLDGINLLPNGVLSFVDRHRPDCKY
jgi:8-oxo-dGTP pyrophosphatase MutT (NUDIX family)